MRIFTPAAEVRSWRAVPLGIMLLASLLLGLRILSVGHDGRGLGSQFQPLPPVPSEQTLSLFAFGDPATLGAVLLLWLQTFDSQAGRQLSYRHLDYGRLIGWLDRIHALMPRSHYPLLLATRVYSSTTDRQRMRAVLEFTHRVAMTDPARFWRWLAEAAVLAKHRLGDLPMALEIARDIRAEVPADELPHWARDLELILLEDMGEHETAYFLVQGLLDSGEVQDPDELRFLRQRLKALREQLVDK